MIEVHSHILPGIDDGARDIKEAIDLLKLLKNQGVSSVVATPHFYPDLHKLEVFLDERERAFQILKDGIDDGLLVHHPAKNHIFIDRTVQEIIQQMTNIIRYHRLGFFGYLKRMGIPAPVPIQKYTVWQNLF